MTRFLRATILCLALAALAALSTAVACQRPGPGMSPEEEGAALHPPKKPFEAYLDSLPASAHPHRDAGRWRTLRRFYEKRDFALAWVGPGESAARANSLLLALEQADREGLEPSDYPTRDFASRLDRIGGKGRASDADRFSLDLDLTLAFLGYASDVSVGRLSPGQMEPGWNIPPHAIDLGPPLERATTGEDPRAVLEGLAPKHLAYVRLREALPRYREIAKSGGWPLVPPEVPSVARADSIGDARADSISVAPTLRPGDSAPAAQLNALAARLEREGFLPAEGDSGGKRSRRYDARLSDGLREFQRRHGLEPDGVIGEQTLAAINVPAATRARQIELNMERWRRMPEDPGARYILVNVPGFRLETYEKERLVTRMKVIVGLEGWRTPIFHAHVEHIVLHPSWRVPTSIAVREILPKLRRDPSWLSENHMDVLGLREGGAVPASSINWSKVSADGFPYRLRQRPGPDNPLGNFKFVLPNEYDVYLHDTATPRLFAKDKRALSHGCIRVERPMDLALWLLAPDPKWTPERLQEALADPKTQRVYLSEDVPVYVSYWTAVANEDGSVDSFTDLYGLDAALDAKLRGRRR
jgi:murein L,D-transpeptidase YcbB/YkuD